MLSCPENILPAPSPSGYCPTTSQPTKQMKQIMVFEPTLPKCRCRSRKGNWQSQPLHLFSEGKIQIFFCYSPELFQSFWLAYPPFQNENVWMYPLTHVLSLALNKPTASWVDNVSPRRAIFFFKLPFSSGRYHPTIPTTCTVSSLAFIKPHQK